MLESELFYLLIATQPSQQTMKYHQAYIKCVRFHREDVELQPFWKRLSQEQDEAKGLRKNPSDQFRDMKNNRATTQLVAADFLEEADDLRHHILRQDILEPHDPRFMERGSEKLWTNMLGFEHGDNIYELRSFPNDEYTLAWWPNNLSHGFIAKLPKELIKEITDQLPLNEQHRGNVDRFLTDSSRREPEPF